MLIKMAILYNYDVAALFRANSTRQLFASMSHFYKYTFVESIMRLRVQMLKEIDLAIKASKESQPFKADIGASSNHDEGLESGDSDTENIAIQRKAQIQ
jgi:hypothetical protein